MSILQYKYRQIFKLDAKQLAEEPIDQFFTNLYIYGQMKKKEQLEIKHGS